MADTTSSSQCPRVVHSFWLQGEAAAPPLVRLCFQRWRSQNPGYEIRVLDGNAAVALLSGTTIPLLTLTVQALSDVVRARVLLDGGVWADASVFPIVPLDVWLPELLRDTGFFAFDRPDDDRAIASWFLAASAGHAMTRTMWAEVLRFWSKPRRLANYRGSLIPTDPVREVAPNGGAAGDEYPYFWFHYLFDYLLRTDPAFAEQWERCRKVSAVPPHWLQFLFLGPTPPESEAILQAAAAAPVHKLNWRASYPLELLSVLGYRP